MTRQQLNNSIDNSITNVNTPDGISPPADGANRKLMMDYVDQEKRPYKSYCVFLSQSGENIPVVSLVYENSIGNIVWARSSEGNYNGTLLGAFPGTKVFFPNRRYCIYTDGTDQRNIYMTRIDDNTIGLNHNDGTNGIDGFGIYLEIRVYN